MTAGASNTNTMNTHGEGESKPPIGRYRRSRLYSTPATSRRTSRRPRAIADLGGQAGVGGRFGRLARPIWAKRSPRRRSLAEESSLIGKGLAVRTLFRRVVAIVPDTCRSKKQLEPFRPLEAARTIRCGGVSQESSICH